VAENQFAAGTLGLSPDVVASINWAAGTALGALGAILVAPILGLQVNSITTLMLAALAGALVGRLRSFSVTLAACLVLGIAQNEVVRYVTDPNLIGLGPTLPFLVIIVVMVVRGQAIPLRDFLLERLPLVGSGRVRPLLLIVTAAAVLGFTALLTDTWTVALATTFAYATFLLTYIVIIGYTGQVSLAQWAIAGFGAWVAGRTIAQGVSFPLGVLIGIVATVPAAVVIGLPALRTRGINLAIITLGAATFLEAMIFDNPNRTGGYNGTNVTLSIFGWSFDEISHPYRYAAVCFGCFVVTGLVVANVRRGLSGRRMLAVRNNERAATALGIHVPTVKLYSFGLAGAIAALGGILVSFAVGSIDYTQFSVLGSIEFAAFAFFGGIGFILGTLQGAILSPGSVGTQFGNTFVPGLAGYLGLIGGVGLMVLIVFNQDGVAGEIARHGKWLARHVPKPFRWSSRGHRAATVLGEEGDYKRARVEPKTVDVRGLTVRYGAVVALEDVSLTIRPGTVTGLIGPNGAGKTSLLDAVTGFSQPAAGSVLLAGEDITKLSAVARARAGIGRSFQSLELFEDMTVAQNILAASDPRGIRYNFTDLVWPTRSKFGPELSRVVQEFQLAADLDVLASELPYGRRRLLAIARAVAARPSVLLLDEPAAGLSGQELRELAMVVTSLAREWGMAVLLIEHDIEFVLQTCDELEVIDFGRTISRGTPDVVRNDPAVITAYLGTATATRAEQANGDEPAPAPRPARPHADAVLVASGLTAGYGAVPTIRDVDLELRPGELVALLGPNGAGKSTTLRTLAGGLSTMSGEVRLDGKVTRAPLHVRAREGIAYIPEERSVFRSLSCRDNLRLSDCDLDRALAIFPALKPRLGIPGGMLSGGEQQMLALGRALSRKPRIIIADELSLGLAPLIVEELLDVLRAAAEDGAAVLLVEQHVRQALSFADYAHVMRRGRIELSDTAANMTERIDEIEQTYLSVGAVAE
jgi:sulfate-transporting ATPase